MLGRDAGEALGGAGHFTRLTHTAHFAIVGDEAAMGNGLIHGKSLRRGCSLCGRCAEKDGDGDGDP